MVWHWLTIFGQWVYHHERIVQVDSWSDTMFTFDPKVKLIWFMTLLCLWATDFLSFDRVILCFGMWVYHHGTMCRVHSWPLDNLDLWPQYQNYIFTLNLSLARLSLLFNIGKPNFGIWTVSPWDSSWPLYDLDLLPICRWRGVSLVRFTQVLSY